MTVGFTKSLSVNDGKKAHCHEEEVGNKELLGIVKVDVVVIIIDKGIAVNR